METLIYMNELDGIILHRGMMVLQEAIDWQIKHPGLGARHCP